MMISSTLNIWVDSLKKLDTMQLLAKIVQITMLSSAYQY